MANLTYEAKNDSLIRDLIADDRYSVRDDGTVWLKIGGAWRQTGKAISNKRNKQYRTLKYKGHLLVVHRIIYCKYIGELDASLVINHIDGNSLNNRPSNLEQATHRENSYHAHAMHTY